MKCVHQGFVAVVLLLGLAGTVQAQELSEVEAREGTQAGFDVEVDPLAYIASGHSLHVGLWLGEHIRLDLGAFGLEVPEAFHGNEGFTTRASGFGSKADWVFGSGLFVGAEASMLRGSVVLRESGVSRQWNQLNVGARVGWRVGLPAGFSVVPWVGVGWGFGARDLAFDDKTYTNSKVQLFPTVHLAYRIK